MIRLEPTALPEVQLVHLEPHDDERGTFVETYERGVFTAAGIDVEFVQDNYSRTDQRFTVRGLHFQRPPLAQDKLVRVGQGRVFDVVVDLRRGSPTYGAHVALVLDAAAWTHLFVPTGFAHGFCTLTPECVVMYKLTSPYSPEHEGGVLWNDPDLGIDWPVDPPEATVSARDRSHPRLRDLGAVF